MGILGKKSCKCKAVFRILQKFYKQAEGKLKVNTFTGDISL